MGFHAAKEDLEYEARVKSRKKKSENPKRNTSLTVLRAHSEDYHGVLLCCTLNGSILVAGVGTACAPQSHSPFR